MHLNALSPNIKKKEDINFQLDILIRDPTSSSFILTQVTPFTLGMIYKEPVTAILASLIRKLNKSVVSYQFPSSTLYARQYFTCFENTFENCKPWFILLNDEFVSTVQSVIVVPFEKELLDVLDFIRQIFVVFPMLQPEIFFNTEDEVAASLQKFFIQNKLTSLEGKLSEFLLSHVSRRILSLPLYSCLKRIWTDASTVPSFLHRSLLRLQLSAKIISKSNSYSYRIIDLYFANACILSHNVAITVSSTCTNSYTDGDSTVNYSLIQAAASAFYTAFPTDMSTNSDKYLLSLQKYILQNRNKS